MRVVRPAQEEDGYAAESDEEPVEDLDLDSKVKIPEDEPSEFSSSETSSDWQPSNPETSEDEMSETPSPPDAEEKKLKAFWGKYKVKRDFHNPTMDEKLAASPKHEPDVEMEQAESEASTDPYSSDSGGSPRRIGKEEIAELMGDRQEKIAEHMGDVASPNAFATEVATAAEKELENARAGLASSSNPAGQPLVMATPHVERPKFWAEPEVETPLKVKAS